MNMMSMSGLFVLGLHVTGPLVFLSISVGSYFSLVSVSGEPVSERGIPNRLDVCLVVYILLGPLQ